MDYLFRELARNIEGLYYKMHYGNHQTTHSTNTQKLAQSFDKKSSHNVPRRNFEQPFRYPPQSFLDISSNYSYATSNPAPMCIQYRSIYNCQTYNPSQYWMGDTLNRVSLFDRLKIILDIMRLASNIKILSRLYGCDF